MKKLCFIFLIPIFLIYFETKLESRQYNIDYLMDLIERGDEESVLQFFAQPNYVTKMKHVIEFTELFRSKIEERFGYKPSYREAYEKFKSMIPNLNLSEKQEKLFHSMFKEVIKNSEKAEQKGLNMESITMDFKGSKDSDFDMPDQLVIAYNEGLGGCLMCIIPSPVTYAVGGFMIGDALKRAYDCLDKKNSQSKSLDYSDHGSATENDTYDRGHDRDSWDKEY